jgi:hypothetical protein
MTTNEATGLAKSGEQPTMDFQTLFALGMKRHLPPAVMIA